MARDFAAADDEFGGISAGKEELRLGLACISGAWQEYVPRCGNVYTVQPCYTGQNAGFWSSGIARLDCISS